MKYKVILYNGASAAAVDEGCGFTFYTFNSAHECAQAWANRAAVYEAILWDGSTWRSYS